MQKKKVGCISGTVAALGILLSIIWAIVSEIYVQPLGEKIAARWGCLSNVDRCIATFDDFVKSNVWWALLLAHLIGVLFGLLFASRLRSEGIQISEKLNKWARLGRHEKILIRALKQSPDRRIVVRRESAQPTLQIGTSFYGGAADPHGAKDWLNALEKLESQGRVKNLWGRSEIYELIN